MLRVERQGRRSSNASCRVDAHGRFIDGDRMKLPFAHGKSGPFDEQLPSSSASVGFPLCAGAVGQRTLATQNIDPIAERPTRVMEECAATAGGNPSDMIAPEPGLIEQRTNRLSELGLPVLGRGGGYLHGHCNHQSLVAGQR